MKASQSEGELVIDFNALDRFDPLITDELLEQPEKVFEAFQQAIENIDMPGYSNINVRLTSLPEKREKRIRNLRSSDIGKLICIEGIVKSATEVMPQIYKSIYKCPDCGALIEVEQRENTVKKPNFCECGRRSGFILEEELKMDVRWITVNEPFDLTEGEKPGEIKVFLKGGLTTTKMQRRTDPGNRLRITGTVKEQAVVKNGKKKLLMTMIMDANNVEYSEKEYEDIVITEEDEKKIEEFAKDPEVYRKLRASIAPGIYGHDEIKDAILMQMFGGTEHRSPDGTKTRGNIHILITGDPGVAKSQILKLVADIIPRGRYVSGKGVTGAGLTATVRKDEEISGSWVLEAGALILANKGLISIDEFDKMNVDDQVAMHEAMSIETVSIAKASISATLPAKTAVLAAANPQLGRFDPMRSIIEQIKIPETLMSRFDLKFALRDVPERSSDERIVTHILHSRTEPDTVKPIVDTDLFRKYIAYAKMKCPSIQLSEDAKKMLKEFYVDMRNKNLTEGSHAVAITLRQFEALIRLAQASAKIKLKDYADQEDAQRAIELMKFSLRQLGADPETGEIDIDRIESGVTNTQRGRIKSILDLIDELGTGGKEIPLEDLSAEAEQRGIANIEEVVERLKRDGNVFEPRHGYIKKL